MLDIRWGREAMPDQFAPFVEIGRFTKILGVVFQCLPLHIQPIALRQLVRALQGHELAACAAFENWRGFLHAGLEFAFQSRLDVDLRNYEDHGEPSAARTIIRSGIMVRGSGSEKSS